jgi:hypothetical protein
MLLALIYNGIGRRPDNELLIKCIPLRHEPCTASISFTYQFDLKDEDMTVMRMMM